MTYKEIENWLETQPHGVRSEIEKRAKLNTGFIKSQAVADASVQRKVYVRIAPILAEYNYKFSYDEIIFHLSAAINAAELIGYINLADTLKNIREYVDTF